MASLTGIVSALSPGLYDAIDTDQDLEQAV